MPVDLQPRSVLRTHTVENQPLPLGAYNAYHCDTALQEAVAREGAAWATPQLLALGEAVGDPANVDQATLANLHSPTLRRFDPAGRRVDQVEFHPAWHHIMGMAWRHGLPTGPWTDPRAGAHVAKAAKTILFNELEGGCMCPVAITYGGVPMLRIQPDISALWEPQLLSTAYDGRPLPVSQKTGATAAFAATEKQGGSDMRSNATTATPVGTPGPGREYLLTGHKWWVSSAGADVIMVSARTDKGVSVFAVPRWLPDGTRNAISIERIKDKMGNRANPSVEMEFDNAHGWMVGEDGRGIANMMIFMQYSRFEVSMMPVGEMRLTLTHAIHHARQRSAFGKALIHQPLMKNVLADMALEYEASLALSMRIARSLDSAAQDDGHRAFARLAVAIAKYWHCKRAVPFVQEAMEVHGAAGYVEESVIPRFYREAPVNNIWEGSGNVICLDILRALQKDPLAKEVLFAQLQLARGGNAQLDRAMDGLPGVLAAATANEAQARRLAQQLALCLQGGLMVQHAPAGVGDAFCASRFGADGAGFFGTLPEGVDFNHILARTMGGELA